MSASLAAFAPFLFLLLSDPAAQPQATVFQTTSQMVLVPVTVTDRYAKTIEGLHADDFAVFDNQQPQRITSFGTDDAPSSVGIVLDVSGSMHQALAGARDTLKAFFATSNPEDEYMLLTVSTQPGTLSGFTANTASLEDNITFARPGGLTSLIDTTYLALKEMKQAHQPRRALLVLSDGFDNHSRYSQSELISLALEADVQVYSMIFDTGLPGASGVPFRPSLAGKPWDVARDRQGPDFLEKLSEKTGGLSFHVRSDGEMKDAVVRTARALRSEYLIGFRPADSGPSGKFHQIRVKSNVPKLYVHARNGYYSR